GEVQETMQSQHLVGKPASLAPPQCLTHKPFGFRKIATVEQNSSQVPKRVNCFRGIWAQGALTDLEDLSRHSLRLWKPPRLRQDKLVAFHRIQRVTMLGAQQPLPTLPGLLNERFGVCVLLGPDNQEFR